MVNEFPELKKLFGRYLPNKKVVKIIRLSMFLKPLGENNVINANQ